MSRAPLAWSRLASLVGASRRDPTRRARRVGPRPAGPAAVRLRAAERRRDRLLRRGPRADLGLRSARRARSAAAAARRGSVAVVAAAAQLDVDRRRLPRRLARRERARARRAVRPAPPSSAGRSSGRFRSSRSGSSACSTTTSPSRSGSCSRSRRTRSRSSRPPYIGLRATGSRAVGVAAAALFAVWPLLTRPLAGTSAWENGQWNVDVGLHLYTEPISTALVATAIALLLARVARRAPARDWPARCSATRRSCGPRTGSSRPRPSSCWRFGSGRGGRCRLRPRELAFAPLVAVYWPKGYPKIENVPGFSLAQADRSWVDSLIFDPRTLLILLPLAVLGLCRGRPLERCAARRRDRDERRPLHLLRAHASASALPLRHPAGALRARGGGSLVSDS